MNNAVRALKEPKGKCLTSILANCGDSGSPQYGEIYFTSQTMAEQWVANPDNAHRLRKVSPESKDRLPPVVYRQHEAWVDADGKYHLYKGENIGLVEVFVVN